ncbi:homologous recombination OB-fold protein [Sorex fumeus]|uniref:homologous recombination OB-fold protein n=1 Tax=Sorex fumeus TaxID=62283 RepID=UPI0024ADDCFC|nr:homologous recombination OB-fold protein [Sorex fumeus]
MRPRARVSGFLVAVPRPPARSPRLRSLASLRDAVARPETFPSPPDPRRPQLANWGRPSPAVVAMACSLQKLFAVGEEFEDEDFLSAVEDAESQCAGPWPMRAACLQPGPSRPQDSVSEQLPACPPAPSEASGLPARGLRLPAISLQRPPASVGTAALGPESPPCGPEKGTLSKVGAPPLAPRPGLAFESQQPGLGDFEGPEQDEFDKVLADMELEGPGLEPTPGLFREAQGILPTEDTLSTKKAPPGGPVLWVPRMLSMSARKSGPQSLLSGPLSLLRLLVGPFRAAREVTSPVSPACLQRAPRPCGDSPIGTPKGPQAALQTPIVTNRLVQLVSAANRTPQQPPRPGPRSKARRFPGPAGVLPHQHSGKNLEEIMVSTPQTPTHGALAKLRTKVVTSSQTSVEEDFGRGPWLTMKSALGLDERDPACFLCSYSIVMVLRKAALRQLPRNKVPSMAVMIKSLTRSTVDASAVFRDPTGEMQGTVHRLLLESRHSELKPGSVLLLKQVGVFSPSLRNHYLNVTPSNLVRIYCCDTRDGGLGTEPADSQDGLLQDETGKPEKGLTPARTPETGAAPEEELPEADDLDGLLSELPEDFFCGTSTGQPP